MRRILLAITMLAQGAAGAGAGPESGAPVQVRGVRLERGMSLVLPSLLEIGSRTDFFMQLADRVGFTEAQRAALEEVGLEFREYKTARVADLGVADAELQRLLARDLIDLDLVSSKLREIGVLETDIKMHMIESLLSAINALNHDQHLRITALLDAPPEEILKPERGMLQSGTDPGNPAGGPELLPLSRAPGPTKARPGR